MKNRLKIIPLGGMEEIGKNITVIEYGGDIVIIDCGSMFPDGSMPGIQLVIPDFSYLTENKDRIRALLITHGHEDHIGAVPYLLRQLRIPVYGTGLAIELIRQKCAELNVEDPDLRKVVPGDTVEAGCFRIEFIKTSHSVSGSAALAIGTPAGTVIHTGDFKVDFTPVDGEPIDINRFAYYGTKGVFALLSDSTNVERPGYTPSEKEIGRTFDQCFDDAKGRVIVATFASNVTRIQQIADTAVLHNRVLCFQGRSMEQIVRISRELGYLSIPDESIIAPDALDKYEGSRICVITTGSQGEPMSGLFRMASSTHRVSLGKGDTVIISASVIPGNERDISRVIDQLYRKGCDVIYDRLADIHVSGHACREELRLMLALTKPKFFIPVHGEYRHLLLHARLAEDMGINPSRVFLLKCGDVLELYGRKGQISGSVPSGSVMVDGLGDMNDVIINDRKLLAENGIFIVAMTVSKTTGKLLCEPQVVSRGFIYMRDSGDLLAKAREILLNEAQAYEAAGGRHIQEISSSVKTKLKSFLRAETHRNPMVLTIIQEVDTDEPEYQ